MVCECRATPAYDCAFFLRTGVGKAEEQILKYAGEVDADLIAMGRQGASELGKELFGNVTEKFA